MKIVNRVRDSNDFALIVKTGKTIKNESYTIHYLINNSKHARVGISVSSKLGCAVIRNKCKRQVRAICDSLIDYNNYNYDLVIILRNKFLVNDFQTNKKLLQEIISRIGDANEKSY